MLIFDPTPPNLRWCRLDCGEYVQGLCRFDSDWIENLEKEIPGLEEEEVYVYRLYHGGNYFPKTISRLESSSLSQMEKCIRLLPEHNDIIRKVAEYLYHRFPAAQHILASDTAFFRDIPSWVTEYAVPQKLKDIGIRKYGSNGIGHQWAAKTAKEVFPTGKKVITVYLGNNTSLAAIENGRARESSSGFTPLEGIPSATGCGQIDPTILFQLYSAGYSFEGINRILTRESGFTGLKGSRCEYSDLLKRDGETILDEIRDIYCYNVIKQIGAFIATLEGIDTVVFFTTLAEESLWLIELLGESLIPLGLKFAGKPAAKRPGVMITTLDSSIGIVLLSFDRWKVIADEVQDFLQLDKLFKLPKEKKNG